MGLEAIIAAGIAAIVGVFGAFFAGGYRARIKANADNDIREQKRISESNTKAAQAQVTATKNAVEVQNEVSNLSNGAAIAELRKSYSRDKNS